MAATVVRRISASDCVVDARRVHAYRERTAASLSPKSSMGSDAVSGSANYMRYPMSESAKTPLISLSFPTSATSSVQVAIWENDQEKNGEHFTTHSCTVQR